MGHDDIDIYSFFHSDIGLDEEFFEVRASDFYHFTSFWIGFGLFVADMSLLLWHLDI